jgi:hypothetical protein
LTITGAGSVTVQANQAGNNTYNAAPAVNQTFTVNPLPVILTGTRAYNGGTTAGYAILSAANKVGSDTISVASGSATLASANAGSEALQSSSLSGLTLGNNSAGNYTLTGASGSVTVTALPVQLTGTRTYDGTATASYTILSVANAISPDAVNVASGSATLASANAGSEAIQSSSFSGLTLGNNSVGDYTLTGASGSVTITEAGATNIITASQNPATPSQPMTFTATLSALPPGAGTPAGTVVFKTNGVPASTNTLVSGVATLTLPAGALPHGANTVTNEYAGDGLDFLGSTNSVVEVVNTPPTSPGTTTTTLENQAVTFYAVKLLAQASDADGDPLVITNADSVSANGGAVVLDNPDGIITYTPALNYVGSDSFTYTVSDNWGGTVVVTVTVNVTSPSGGGVSLNIVSPPAYDSVSGTFSVTFAGIPTITYAVQTATSPTGPWSFLKTVTAGADGLIQVTDTQNPPPPARYYRMIYP